MLTAIELAGVAMEKGEVPVGAVITRDNHIIAKAYNEIEISQDPTAHAEVIAIRKAAKLMGNWRLTGCTMYVSLEPCFMCMGAILNARIDKLVYALGDTQRGAVESNIDLMRNSLFNKMEIYSGICEEESKILLKKFFINKRN